MSKLTLTTIAQPGDRVELQSILSEFETEADRKNYVTKIYDIRDDEEFEVFMPIEKTTLQLLSVGSEYEVFIYAQKGIYACNVVVSERYKTENAFVAVLQLSGELIKHQRREFYRYSTIIGMNTRQLNEEEENFYLEEHKLVYGAEPGDKSVIVDISGGGIRFISAEPYEKNRLLQCRFILRVKETNQMVDCVIRLLGMKPVANNPNNKEYRGQFLFLNEYERETIIKYIFEEERKTRQRR